MEVKLFLWHIILNIIWHFINFNWLVLICSKSPSTSKQYVELISAFLQVHETVKSANIISHVGPNALDFLPRKIEGT